MQKIKGTLVLPLPGGPFWSSGKFYQKISILSSTKLCSGSVYGRLTFCIFYGILHLCRSLPPSSCIRTGDLQLILVLMDLYILFLLVRKKHLLKPISTADHWTRCGQCLHRPVHHLRLLHLGRRHQGRHLDRRLSTYLHVCLHWKVLIAQI